MRHATICPRLDVEHPEFGICCIATPLKPKAEIDISNGDSSAATEYSVATYVFPDIVQAFWWAIVTMTTCGYGDKIPQTPGGKLLGCVSMLCGILLIALPVAIVGRNFQDAYEKMEEETALDHARSSTSREFRAKMATFSRPQMSPLVRIDTAITDFTNYCGEKFTRDITLSGTMKDISHVLGQTKALNETLYKLQCAELLRQDEIFESMDKLFKYVEKKNSS